VDVPLWNIKKAHKSRSENPFTKKKYANCPYNKFINQFFLALNIIWCLAFLLCMLLYGSLVGIFLNVALMEVGVG
jgi:hypothetical protein